MRLNRTKQCKLCPWRVSTNPLDIPNNYDVERHRALSRTISEGVTSLTNPHAMACHESHEDFCLGWLVNQMTVGNNIGLRIRMMDCENYKDVKLFGEQHERFEDTLPDFG